MGKCQFCGREMKNADGCTVEEVRINGEVYKRNKFGLGIESDEYWVPGSRCGDCGCLFGHYHHPGCDMERIPEDYEGEKGQLWFMYADVEPVI